MSLKDIEHALMPKVKTNPTTVLPKPYKKFLKVFSQEEANKMLSHHPGIGYTIDMKPGTQPPGEPLYCISRNKLQVLKKYLKGNLSKRFIQALLSPVAATILFVKKPENGLPFCVNYCGFNALTIKNKYFLPLINETPNCLFNAIYFCDETRLALELGLKIKTRLALD